MADNAVALLPAQFKMKLGTLEITKQLSEATLKFDISTTTVRTLTEETDLATGEKCTLTLAGYQDWTEGEDASLCWVLWNGSGKTATFELTGENEAGDTVVASGSFQARRPTFGPTADDAARFSIDIPVIGIPDLEMVDDDAGGAVNGAL
jgi:hypothetical protein